MKKIFLFANVLLSLLMIISCKENANDPTDANQFILMLTNLFPAQLLMKTMMIELLVTIIFTK